MNQKNNLKKIPELEMMAGWNVDNKGRITKFSILSSLEMTKDDYDKHESWEGRDSKNWGNGDFRTSALGLYTYLASEHGFFSRDMSYSVLKQFSKVEDQEWAKLTRDSMDGRLL